jgi:hypothetical protein
MNDVLQPHLSTLKLLVGSQDTLDDTDIPVLRETRGTKDHSFASLVVDANRGALTLRELAAINNWLHIHIGNGDQKNQVSWFVSLAAAHARTLWCSSLVQAHNDSRGGADLDEATALSKAWDVLKSTGRVHKVDINKECIAKLERLMFEVSWRAGKAGDKQWGMNVGDHQANWDPYAIVPIEWIQKKDIELDSDARVVYLIAPSDPPMC